MLRLTYASVDSPLEVMSVPCVTIYQSLVGQITFAVVRRAFDGRLPTLGARRFNGLMVRLVKGPAVVSAVSSLDSSCFS